VKRRFFAVVLLLCLAAMMIASLEVKQVFASPSLTLFESYTENDNAGDAPYNLHPRGQTFTVQTTHNITQVGLKLYREGSPGTLIVKIEQTSLGKPSGSVLCQGSIDGNSLTTDTEGAWYNITLGSGAILYKGIQYAITCFSTGYTGNKVLWRYDGPAPAGQYSGGARVWSISNGSSWNYQVEEDFMFEDWERNITPLSNIRFTARTGKQGQ